MTKTIGDWTLEVNRDDRGRIVAEVWNTASGKTLAIEEVDSERGAEAWANKAIRLYAPDTTVTA